MSDPERGDTPDTRRFAVKLRASADADAVAAMEARHGIVALRRIAPLRLCVYALTTDAADALRADPLVDYVEEERTLSIR